MLMLKIITVTVQKLTLKFACNLNHKQLILPIIKGELYNNQ